MCLLKQDAAVDAVRAALKEFQKSSSLTLADIAKGVNRSAALVSQFLADKYAGNIDELRQVFIEYLNREHKRRLERLEIPNVITTQAAMVFSVCNLIHESKDVGLIYGPSGMGKTTALEMYRSQNSQSIMITCYSKMTSGAICMEIVDELGLKPNKAGDKKGRRNYYGNMGYLIKLIKDELKGKDILLIVDEAQHLKLAEFEQIRYFHDVAGIPLIYAGSDDVLEQMVGGKFEKDFDQIYSRCPVIRSLESDITREDVEKIINGLKLKFDNEMITYLVKKANEKGHYRKLRHLLQYSIRFSIKDNQPLELVHLMSAEEMQLDKQKLVA